MHRKKLLTIIGILAMASMLFANGWEIQPTSILTKWANDVQPDNVWSEYPRPMLQRDKWLNLNGLWEYTVLPKSLQPKNFEGEILVPFPVESPLSGVIKMVSPQQRLWYRREFKVPKEWQQQQIWLNFEAVDWETTVWINGKLVGIHKGGYDPFKFNITDYLKNDKQEILVSVWDPTDEGTQPRGKQVLNPQGYTYTSTTGIWGTVWLEPLPKTYIKELYIVTNIDDSLVTIKPQIEINNSEDELEVIITDAKDKTIIHKKFTSELPIKLKINQPKFWYPKSPYLYNLKISLIHDEKVIDKIESYFGLRKISLEKDEKGITRLFLNNKYLFQIGTLDQGFWPDGIYTAPTDEALKYDIEMIKKLGFNMLRKHVKVENRRFYYWCDKIGILVWQDMPNGDKTIDRDGPDLAKNNKAAEQFEFELRKMITTKFNHPSIVMWVPFNEGWGQFDTPRIVKLTKQLDPTRLVNAASGWADRGIGDIHDVHHYPEPHSAEPEENRALVCGEFGGLGFFVQGHTYKKESFGYQMMTTPEEYIIRYEELIGQGYDLEKRKGLSAMIYTQITDVETEINGIMTYDREVVKGDINEFKKINAGNFVSMPWVDSKGGMFHETQKVTMKLLNGDEIRFTLNGDEPDQNSELYIKPIEITKSVLLKAKAFSKSGKFSRTRKVEFTWTQYKAPIYKHMFSQDYSGGGIYALIDGKTGSENFHDGIWQGFELENVDVTFEFPQLKKINSVSVNFLQNTEACIFYPQKVLLEVSSDGKNYEQVGSKTFTLSHKMQNQTIKKVKVDFNEKEVKYFRLIAKNIQTCPDWHSYAGGKAWIFIDELAFN